MIQQESEVSRTPSLLTIPEMVKLVGPGEKRTFPCPIEPTETDGRFYEVGVNFQNDNKPYDMQWVNAPEMQLAPRPAKRHLDYIPLSSVSEFDLHFKGKRKQLVDYYQLSLHVKLLSPQLYELFLEMDPGAIDSRPVKVEILGGSGGSEIYWAILTARVLDAIDLERSEVTVKQDEFLPGRFKDRVYFNKGFVIRDDLTGGAHAFRDYWMGQWLCSEELLDAAAARGIRGLSGTSTLKSHVRPYINL